MRLAIRWAFLAVTILFPRFSRAAIPDLGEAPAAPTAEMIARLREQQGPQVLGPTGPFAVRAQSREEVRNFFNTVYAASQSFAIGWTGDLSTCTPGTTDAAFRDQVALRINYFRAMAGVPANIVFDGANNAKDQGAALMMSANGALSHTPPPTWNCYTADGADAAGNSNIAIGNAGPDAITAYIEDFGNNNSAAGHRRWLLYPQTETMGTGDLPEPDAGHYSANAVWVFDANYGGPRPATRDGFVAWPPPGYIPYQLTFPRWSFSLPNTTYAATIVTLSSNGVNVPLTRETVVPNVGEPTLVWFPTAMNPTTPTLWSRPAADTVFTVQLQNVLVGGKSSNFTYTVTVFDPAVPGADTVLPAITGPDAPAVNQANSYSFPAVPGATGYQWQSSRRAAFTAVEGAENGLTDFEADTSAGYDVATTNPRHSGSYAFHLAHPDPPRTQRLTCQRTLLPDASSQLRFWSRLAYASTDQVAKVELSLDGGSSWQAIYQQAGSDGAGESSFTQETVSLSSFAGRTVQVRFGYEFTSGSYYAGADNNVGWFFDDISFTGTEELSGALVADVPSGTNFVFTPTQSGGYALDVRAQVYGQFYLEWGPVKRVDAAVAAVPSVQFTGAPLVSGNQVQVDFEVTNYRAGLTFELLTTATATGTWSTDSAATFQTVVAGSRFRATTSNAGKAQSFYRLSVN